ncbi:MAG: MMPL family transporter [Solirubrobacterales bacterium]
MRGSPFTFPAGRRAKWIVVAVWLAAIVVAAGPAQLIAKFDEAEDNESTSYLPGDAESTAALEATEVLQGGELAPAVIVFRRDEGLTPADFKTIEEAVAAMTVERFDGVIADGTTAASGGESGEPAEAAVPPGSLPPGCGGQATTVPGQPPGYQPFVGPVCSEDGKAALISAYIKPEGDGRKITEPIDAWQDVLGEIGGGLEAKITGGAGFSADAVKVFENINGTLLLAAVSLVIFLLIVIYRSPMFFLLPVVAVLFAEALSRSLGYGVSELGFTVNGQSSSIMSVLVLGAGTDYALLLVARYREELHHSDDRHAAMRTALASAGPTIFASAATVIAALLCLMLADVNGTAGLGPIGAIGIFCAALSMLTLLPALLTIVGRRAFWPFVPHTPETAPDPAAISARAREKIVDGPAVAVTVKVVLSCLVVLVLGIVFLPVVLLYWVLRRLSGGNIPPLISPLDRRIFTPYEFRRHRSERQVDATHGVWKRVGDRVAARPLRVMAGAFAVLLVLCAGFAFFSTDLTENDSFRGAVESVEGQDLVNESFPSGATAPTNVVVADPARVEAVREAVAAVPGVEAVAEPVAQGVPGVLFEATLEPEPYSTAAIDLVDPLREAVHRAEPDSLVGGPTAVQHDLRVAASRDSLVIPPLILIVVFLILIGLLRALAAPLVLIGTVILSFLAALGFGYLVFDLVFGFPGSDPSLPLAAFVFLVALGVDYNIFLIARAREEAEKHGSKQGILRALAVTGGVITSAGIVLAGTFSVLAVLPLVFLTELGFVVAFGVLLDTFLVRSVLVPSIALTMGNRFWWPSALSRRQP